MEASVGQHGQGQGEQGAALCTGAVPAGFLGLEGWLELQEQG